MTMELKNLFKLGAISTALILAGCGGDINISTAADPAGPTIPITPPPATQTPQEIAYSGFATKSTSVTSVDAKEVWVLKGALGAGTAAKSSSPSAASTGGQTGSNIVLGNDVVWQLDGAVIVGGDNADSINLTLEAGTKVLGGSDSYLVISRGSTIIAEGTKAAPIVFTSLETALGQAGKAGQWGGLVLLGNAPVNSCPDLTNCSAAFEVGNHSYGGNDTQDSSGSLKYVRVEFGGFKINDTQEMNGIST
jgi:hypothetical protein